MPQDRGQRRRRSYSRSRTPSPGSNKHKRSWQASASSSSSSVRTNRRSPSPHRSNTKRFKSPPKFGANRKEYFGDRRSRSRSPKSHKKQRPKSPVPEIGFPSYKQAQQRYSPSTDRNRLLPRRAGSGERSGSRVRQRSPSPPPPPQSGHDRGKQPDRFRRSSRSPEPRRDRVPGVQEKKKDYRLSPPPTKRPRSNSPRSRSPRVASSSRAEPSRKRPDEPMRPSSTSNKMRDGSIPQRRVSTSEKKKPSRMTLHQRFTTEDQEPVDVEENVTIAILRNPDAEPSEETTVKRVFDASLFKMVHRKQEGRKPIFDREEIKVWRHDDNLADDPDFERRLVRVKSSSKPASGKINRLSPDVIRKAFGRQTEIQQSSSRSPHGEPQIRLDARPDPKYESKYRQQMKKEDAVGRRVDRGASPGERGVKRKQEDDTYDLRQALERRRSDRDDGGFKIEVSRREREPSTELYYRNVESKRPSSAEAGRSVVMGHGRQDLREENTSRDDRQRGCGRGRGGWRSGFNRNQEWSPEASRERRETSRSDDRRSPDRRQARYSTSPSRGGRRAGFRPRGRGRGRDNDFRSYEQEELTSPADMNAISDSYKYLQHDDRDVSPKPYRGRGRGSRFQSRGFGSSAFRANSRGFRRGGRYRGSTYRGYGGRSPGDRRSVERRHDLSEEREWKHDMYDSLQSEEEQPHSTTVGT